jgi:hypothetical protein
MKTSTRDKKLSAAMQKTTLPPRVRVRIITNIAVSSRTSMLLANYDRSELERLVSKDALKADLDGCHQVRLEIVDAGCNQQFLLSNRL